MEEARIAEEMHWAAEEERAAEGAQRVAVELGSWEERIWVLRLQTEVEVEAMAEAFKSGSSNPGQSWTLLPLQELEAGLCLAKVSSFFILCFIILTHCSLQCRNGSLVPGVHECKNKMCNDKGGVMEREVRDREKVREAEGGRRR